MSCSAESLPDFSDRLVLASLQMKSLTQRQLRTRERTRVSLPPQTESTDDMGRKASSLQHRTVDNAVVLDVFVEVSLLAEGDCSAQEAKIAGTSQVCVGSVQGVMHIISGELDSPRKQRRRCRWFVVFSQCSGCGVQWWRFPFWREDHSLFCRPCGE